MGTSEGHKRVLNFELGSSENAEVAKDLMRRLTKRGFHCDRPLLSVLDGSAALRSAVKEFFPDAVVQRGLVHTERNITNESNVVCLRMTLNIDWIEGDQSSSLV